MIFGVEGGVFRWAVGLSGKAAVELAVDSIAREAAWYEGVNLDLEGLGLKEPGPHRAAFVRFCARLRGVLRSLGKSLTLTLHAPNYRHGL